MPNDKESELQLDLLYRQSLHERNLEFSTCIKIERNFFTEERVGEELWCEIQNMCEVIIIIMMMMIIQIMYSVLHIKFIDFHR